MAPAAAAPDRVMEAAPALDMEAAPAPAPAQLSKA